MSKNKKFISYGSQLITDDQKKEYGQKINDLKNLASDKYEKLKLGIKKSSKSITEDYTKPGFPISSGSLHPITLIKNRIIDIFSKVGFELSEGPEIEDDWHNFTALNLPKDLKSSGLPNFDF